MVLVGVLVRFVVPYIILFIIIPITIANIILIKSIRILQSYFVFTLHTLGLFEIPSQFIPHVLAHLYFSHNPLCPKYADSDVLSESPHEPALLVLGIPFKFLHVLPSVSITQLSGQFEITGGQSPIAFALIMEYITAVKNPSNKMPAIISTMR